MKVLRLDSNQTRSLLDQPESGMGFQIVEVPIAYSRNGEAWIAFNAELAIAFDNPNDVLDWTVIRNAGDLEWLRGQAELPGSLYGAPQVIVSRAGGSVSAHVYGRLRGLAPTPLSLIKASVTAAGARYTRFSAFSLDKRVDPATGDFLPGTYATTLTDEPMAPSGFAAVGRYALPNIMPSKFLHSLTSHAGAPVRSGTVAPAYGQSGGGVEVFFPAGVRNSVSVSTPRTIPDE